MSFLFFCGALLALVGLRHRRIVGCHHTSKRSARHPPCFGRFHSGKTILNCFPLRYHNSARDNFGPWSLTKSSAFAELFYCYLVKVVPRSFWSAAIESLYFKSPPYLPFAFLFLNTFTFFLFCGIMFEK